VHDGEVAEVVLVVGGGDSVGIVGGVILGRVELQRAAVQLVPVVPVLQIGRASCRERV